MIRRSGALWRQRGVMSIEAAVVAGLMGLAVVGVGSWVKYDADFKNDKLAADNLNIVFQGAQSWFTANYATIAAAASPSVAYPFATWQGSVTGAITGANIYRQTYSMRVYKEPSGQLDMVVMTTGGDVIPDGDLRRISRMMGGAGGFVSSAAPTIAQNPAAGWSIPVANLGGSPGGGHLAAAAFFANAAAVQDFLYRHAVPGHPEVNQMSTTLDLNKNSITNAASVAASSVSVVNPGANAVVTMNQQAVIGTPSALYVQTNGQVNVTNLAATQWAPIAVSTLATAANASIGTDIGVGGSAQINGNAQINGSIGVNGNANVGQSLGVNGTITANGPINSGTSMWTNGTVTANGDLNTAGNINFANADRSITNPGNMYLSAGNNLYLNPFGGNRTVVGGGGGSGILETTNRLYVDEFIQPQGGVGLGSGCSPNGLIGNSGSGPAFCINGVWTSPTSFNPRVYATAAPDSGVIGPYNWCFSMNVVVGETSAFGQWGVTLVADNGPGNRFFSAHNSKSGGQVSYACF